jgi:hypothetical protein
MRILHDSPVIVGLTALALVVVSTGCASHSSGGAAARSDRLRESRLPPPAPPTGSGRGGSIANPVVPANFPEPAPPRDAPSPRGADEPDPNAVIDWLLNQKR